MRLFDYQAPRAITSQRRRGSTARDRPSALSHYTQSRWTVNRVYMTARLDVTPKTTKQNRIVCTSKSEAEVTTDNFKKLRSRYCTTDATKLTTDRHEASRGLFATAELLVRCSVGGNLARTDSVLAYGHRGWPMASAVADEPIIARERHQDGRTR